MPTDARVRKMLMPRQKLNTPHNNNPGRRKTVMEIIGDQLQELKNLDARRAALLTEMGAPPVVELSLHDKLIFKLWKLQSGMAFYAQGAASSRWLAAARVIEGLLFCLKTRDTCPVGEQRPDMAGEFGKVARQLVLLAHKHGGIDDPRNASAYPKSIRTYAKAAVVLSKVVEIEKEFGGETGTSKGIAACLEILRMRHRRLGTERVLPHNGPSEARVALFTDAIERLRTRRIDGGKQIYGEEVVSACARACGNRREIFGAIRKQERREDLRGK